MAESKPNKTRRKAENSPKIKGKKFLIPAVILFVWWINNYTLKTVSEEIKSPKISNPVNITVLSDYHIHNFSVPRKTVLDSIGKTSPDAVMVLGDMHSRNSSESQVNMAVDFMADIAAEYDVYFVPGEHDNSAEYLSSLEEKGVNVLCYGERNVVINGNNIRIIGIDNVHYTSTFDLRKEYTLYDDSYNILLAHLPNYEKFAVFGADLTLCADTHGGMFRLPFIGPVYDTQNRIKLPTLRENSLPLYDKGWYDYDGGSMFITSGIGDSPAPVRFMNRPEIVSIEVTSKNLPHD